MEFVIGLIIGLAVAAGVYWIGRREIAGVRVEASRLRSQLDEASNAAQRLREAKIKAETEAQARTREAQTISAERNEAREALRQSERSLSQSTAQLAEIRADHAARVEEMDKFRAELEERFRGIASSVTQSTREDFINEFRDLTKQQSAVSQEAVSNLVKPVRERLAELQKYVDEADRAPRQRLRPGLRRCRATP